MIVAGAFVLCLAGAEPAGSLRAGAAAVDVTPEKYPVIVNGMFTERQANAAVDRLYARALVLDQDAVRLAIVVVDSCMMPRDLLDAAKDAAAKATGIPAGRMLISATHTHSAPAAMGCLGSRVDPEYARWLPRRLALAIERANANLAPAEIGWTVVQDFEHTHCRRWIRRPDKMLVDPFGDRTVRANMHPGYQNPDAIGPSGPVDPDLSVVGVRRPGGRPIALLANYSQHYFGSPLLSADYYGRFAAGVAARLGGAEGFVGMMSQGTSGDQMWMDYGAPQKQISLDDYSNALADRAAGAFKAMKWRASAKLAMQEKELPLEYRVPDSARLAWAQVVAKTLAGRLPKTQPEIYALEALELHAKKKTALKLQAIRIGDLGIAAMPNEVYAITGLKIKAASPLQPTFNISLANGAEGYIPPFEQHALGGYTTWPARTAGLERHAEAKIVADVLFLLEFVADKLQRTPVEPNGAYATTVLDLKPAEYWRLGELGGPQVCSLGRSRKPASVFGGFAYGLPGPPGPAFSGDAINRCLHLAGGRFHTGWPAGLDFTVSFWFWNGLPADARPVTGVLLSGGGGRWEIGGTQLGRAALSFRALDRDPAPAASMKSAIPPKTWRHAVLVQRNGAATFHLGGEALSVAVPKGVIRTPFIFGGEGDLSFEGKLDEVALYDRALTPAEVDRLLAAARAAGDE